MDSFFSVFAFLFHPVVFTLIVIAVLVLAPGLGIEIPGLGLGAPGLGLDTCGLGLGLGLGRHGLDNISVY